jgi:hypothetical protein
MSVTLIGTNGAFTRLGKMGKEYLRVVTAFGTTLDSSVETIRDQFETGAQGTVTDGIYTARNSWKTVHSGWLGYLQSLMQSTVTEQVNDDTALSSKTLSNALAELIRQMKSSSDSILRGTTGATTTAYSGNKGDAKFVTSFLNKYGDSLTMPYPESIRFTCTTDTTNFQEVFTVAGAPTKAVTDATWPGGSGATGTVTLFNAATDSFIKNGNFSDWSNASSPPANWTYITGVGGTTLVRDTTVKRTGVGYAMQFAGDGSTLHDIKQVVSSSLATANKVLCFQAWGKMSAADSNAILRIRLVDGSGTVINNDAGNANSATFDCNTTIGTSFTSISTFFQLPRQIPSTGVYLQITVITAVIDNGKTLNLSLVGLTEATQLYAAGPYCAAFSAASAHAAGDYFTTAVTNDVGNATWVRAGQRWLGLPSLGESFYFPSVASTETVADSFADSVTHSGAGRRRPLRSVPPLPISHI